MEKNNSTTCELCGHGPLGDNVPECLNHQTDAPGLLCTRPRGHDGKHMGCGINESEHPIHMWS